MKDPIPTRAALAILMVTHGLMLFALYTGTEPHPPVRIPLFAMAPFLSALIGCALATWIMAERRAALPLALLTAALSAVSFGPHKYFDAAFPDIWPAVLMSQAAIVTLLYQAYISIREART